MPIITPGGGSGGGGSTPGAGIVRGPFSFTYQTANLNTGVTIYTPTIGDILLDIWIEITTAFDGTTPLADVGTFAGAGEHKGLWAHNHGSGVDASTADNTLTTGLLSQAPLGGSNTEASGLVQEAAWNTAALNGARYVPGRFVTADPLKLVVSQTGGNNGSAVGGTAGAGRVYLVTATPVALP